MLEGFQEWRKILCICPCCGEIKRLSEMHLKYKGAKMTWLDEYENKSSQLDRKEERFEEKEAELRECAVQKGRKQSAKAFSSAVSASFRKYDPFDIKPILHPIDFVVFKGMNKERMSEIVMLSRQCRSLCTARNQVKKAIMKKRYDWQVARVDECGNIEF
jgi:predicted Holliday junction resolvase-like endonuclease